MRRSSGWRSLVRDAIDSTTDVVGLGHDAAGRGALRVASLVPGAAGPAREVDAARDAVTRGVLDTVRAVNGLVAQIVDHGLEPVDAWLPAPPAVPLRSDVVGGVAWADDVLLGAVNGVVGDHLSRRANGLDLGMGSRRGEGPAGPRIAVLVHGLATTEWSWSLDAERLLGDPAATFGTLLERDLGFTPLYIRYNTGRPVADNGAALADHLAAVCAAWPVPPAEIVFVAHSMGGLVTRSALAAGRARGDGWAGLARRVVCLGTPHQGAPLERFGAFAAGLLASVDHPATQVTAAVLRGRSAGIQDLGAHTAPLLDGVAYAFAAGAASDGALADAWLGDLLVGVHSAHGPRPGPGAGPAVSTARFPGVLHHQLQVHPDVYAFVRAFLA